jgi:hypothetical protein
MSVMMAPHHVMTANQFVDIAHRHKLPVLGSAPFQFLVEQRLVPSVDVSDVVDVDLAIVSGPLARVHVGSQCREGLINLEGCHTLTDVVRRCTATLFNDPISQQQAADARVTVPKGDQCVVIYDTASLAQASRLTIHVPGSSA